MFFPFSNAAVMCGQLDPPADGNLNISGFTFSSEAVYTCDFGFSLSTGDETFTRICQNNGWSSAEPTCDGEYMIIDFHIFWLEKGTPCLASFRMGDCVIIDTHFQCSIILSNMKIYNPEIFQKHGTHSSHGQCSFLLLWYAVEHNVIVLAGFIIASGVCRIDPRIE